MRVIDIYGINNNIYNKEIIMQRVPTPLQQLMGIALRKGDVSLIAFTIDMEEFERDSFQEIEINTDTQCNILC
jgi:hypothetical protein